MANLPDSIRDASTLALADLIDRWGDIDLSPLVIYLIDAVHESALPHLVEQFHVDGIEGGNLAENATNRRSLVKGAIALHRIKGTPAALKQAIAAAGFGEVQIIELQGGRRYDGNTLYNNTATYGEWALYHVVMSRPITNDQAALLKALCAEMAPARCKLKSIIYTEVAIRYNGQVHYDGSYNHGAS